VKRVGKKPRATTNGRKRRLASDRAGAAELDRLIAEVVVDAYGDTEQAAAFHYVLEEELELPLQVELGAAIATVVGLELTDDDRLVAVCRMGRSRRRVPLTELAAPVKAPRGSKWLDAYLRWERGR
jgi:Calcium binding